ncbi:MAG TPA: M48 family metalloprotease [Bryobacteraceae bacterium]|jgi:heat shock protein HtpX
MQHLKAAALLSGPVLFILFPAALVGGRWAWWIAGVLAAIAVAVLWRSDTLVLRSLRAEQLEEQAVPGLCAIIRKLAHRQAMSTPCVYVIEDAAPNALLLCGPAGVSRLILTAGLLHALSSNQLAAVIAHHMSLVKNTAAFSMTLAALYGLVLERIPGTKFLRSALLRFAAPLSLKLQADAASAHLIGDPGPLLEALKKIASAHSGRYAVALSHLFLYHPLEPNILNERLSRLASLSLRPVLSSIV